MLVCCSQKAQEHLKRQIISFQQKLWRPSVHFKGAKWRLVPGIPIGMENVPYSSGGGGRQIKNTVKEQAIQNTSKGEEAVVFLKKREPSSMI